MSKKDMVGMLNYVGTPYKCFKDLSASIKKFKLVNMDTNEIVAKSDNPNEFDKIVYGRNKNE